MTEPTDAELDELRQANSGQLNFVTFREFRVIARAVLAKWGTPQPVASEPVAWRYRPSAVWDDYVLTDDPEKAARARGNGLHVEALCLATPPQPTQAQAGAVPLTDEQAASLCKMGPVYAPDGRVVRTPEQYRRELEGAKLAGIRTAERAHGIKGGQHGTS